MTERYTIEEFSHEVSVAEYITDFHNPDEVWSYCRACANHGKQWGCPPFDFDVVARLSKYSSLQLIVTKITLIDRRLTSAEVDNILRQERIGLEKRLLELERSYNGLACSFIGKCLHCKEESCSRLVGKPCRHPQLVRPSLEAYGCDVVRTLSELFNIELQWSKNGTLPEYLVLTCGVFYNADNTL